MGIFSVIGTGLGALGGFLVGGPAGAAIGSGIGGSIGGGVDSSQNAGKAADASLEAARLQDVALQRGIDESGRQFDLSRADQLPFLQTGQQADSRLRDILLNGAPINAAQIPGLEQAKQAGLAATEGSAFANRQGLSGRTLASLYNQGQQFDFAASSDFLNRLQNLSGRGQTSAANLGALGANKSSNVANLLAAQGDVRASGVVGANNARQKGSEGIAQAGSSLFDAISGAFL